VGADRRAIKNQSPVRGFDGAVTRNKENVSAFTGLGEGTVSADRCESEDDEVWRVLEALEESNLRSSRGMRGMGGGLMSAGSRRTPQAEINGDSHKNNSRHLLGPALSPGQAFVAKYRDRSREGRR
jgi:hypothetical protein